MAVTGRRDLALRTAHESRSALIIFVSILSCVGLFVQGFDNPFGQSLSCLIGSLLLFACVLVLHPSADFWRQVRRPVLLIVAAIAWLVAVACVRALGPMEDARLPLAPDLFLPKFLSIIGGLWFLLIGAIMGRDASDRRLAMDWLAVIITLFSAAGLALMLLGQEDGLPGRGMMQEGRFLGLTGNANVTASICGAGALLCVGAGLSRWVAVARAVIEKTGWQTDLRGILSFAGFLLHILAVTLTASRVASLATAAMVALLCLHHASAAGYKVRTLGVVAGAAVLLGMIALLLPSATLIERVASLQPDAQARWLFWERFSGIAGVAPWTGLGPGAFPQANIYFLQNSDSILRQSWIINSPHSIVLQLWFVGGLPYLLLMSGAAGLIVRDLIGRLNLRQDDARHIGLLLAGAIFFFVGLIDIPLDVTASADLAMLLVGLAWGRRRDAASPA